MSRGRKSLYLVVDDIHDGEVPDRVGDLVELLVHGHAGGFGVGTEPDADYAGFFGELVGPLGGGGNGRCGG